jgi:hypothetical protein
MIQPHSLGNIDFDEEPSTNNEVVDLNSEKLRRLAAMVAAGEINLHDPAVAWNQLDPDGRAKLLAAIGERRRGRLIQLIATAIAADIVQIQSVHSTRPEGAETNS